MDDIKIYGKNAKDLDSLVIITQDMRMEFGTDKHTVAYIVRGKITQTEGIKLPDRKTRRNYLLQIPDIIKKQGN